MVENTHNNMANPNAPFETDELSEQQIVAESQLQQQPPRAEEETSEPLLPWKYSIAKRMLKNDRGIFAITQ